MIDTVRLICQARPTPEQLELHWRRRDYSPPIGKTDREFFSNPPRESKPPFRATYRPRSFRAVDQFLIELSLPKALFGNNWTMLEDLAPATDAADHWLQNDEAMPELPSVADMSVSRLDLCWNFQVGELLPYYIDALAKLDYARRTKARFNSQTVEFRIKTAKTKFYDKRAEAGEECPPGILRFEVTFHKAQAVKHALGTRKPVLFGQLDANVLHAVMARELNALGILGAPFATLNEAAARLRSRYGPNRGAYRFMVLQMAQTRDRDQIALELGISRNVVNEALADVRKAGLPLALSEAEASLPPLDIPVMGQSLAQISTETPGVTPGRFVSEAGGVASCE